MKWIVLLTIILGCQLPGLAQEETLLLRSISLEGNKRTRDKIILRELDIKEGDVIPQAELTKRLERNRLLLINTGLFNKVEINIKNWEEDNVDLHIVLKEDWFYYPIPILELADRNFNVWWKDHNHAFNRLNLGLRFYLDNLTGNNDLLKVVAQFGYTQKYELDYRLPFFNRGQSLGLNTNILYTREREVGFENLVNKQRFIRIDDQYSLKRFRVGATLTYRPALFSKHEWEFNYHNKQISNIISFLNPEFLGGGIENQQFLSLGYTFTLDKRDNKNYAMKGFYFQSSLVKNGLGWSKEVNNLPVSATYAQYFNTKKWFSYGFMLKGKAALQRQVQPYYIHRRALGYEEDFIRGYEFYVIDGQDFGYIKNDLRIKLLDKAVQVKAMLLKPLQYMPIKIFLKLNADLGYVNNEYTEASNSLENAWLFGGGPGIDLVLYHEYVVRVEYSFNTKGEKGVFLHYKFFF